MPDNPFMWSDAPLSVKVVSEYKTRARDGLIPLRNIVTTVSLLSERVGTMRVSCKWISNKDPHNIKFRATVHMTDIMLDLHAIQVKIEDMQTYARKIPLVE